MFPKSVRTRKKPQIITQSEPLPQPKQAMGVVSLRQTGICWALKNALLLYLLKQQAGLTIK
jgi:hypothetical protein